MQARAQEDTHAFMHARFQAILCTHVGGVGQQDTVTGSCVCVCVCVCVSVCVCAVVGVLKGILSVVLGFFLLGGVGPQGMPWTGILGIALNCIGGVW